jgi:GNAT superfamily N-acetyltransferase
MFPLNRSRHRVRRLSRSDAASLQVLYERCTDYHEQHEGIPTRPTAAEEELSACPPGKQLSDKFALGVYSPDDVLVGYLDLMRDFPSAGEWQIGLLMLDPSQRGGGLGACVYGAAADWVASQGAHTISLGVLEEAPRAERFWRRMGFEEVSRHPYVSETGRRAGRIIFMRRRLSPRPAGRAAAPEAPPGF